MYRYYGYTGTFRYITGVIACVQLVQMCLRSWQYCTVLITIEDTAVLLTFYWHLDVVVVVSCSCLHINKRSVLLQPLFNKFIRAGCLFSAVGLRHDQYLRMGCCCVSVCAREMFFFALCIAPGALAPENFSQKKTRITVNAPGAHFYRQKSIAPPGGFTRNITVKAYSPITCCK